MVAARPFWIVVWFGILALGLLGLTASVYWGRRTHWRNVDELLRALGTIQASAGMLLLLFGLAAWSGTSLLALALATFVTAFLAGREMQESDETGVPAAVTPPTAETRRADHSAVVRDSLV